MSCPVIANSLEEQEPSFREAYERYDCYRAFLTVFGVLPIYFFAIVCNCIVLYVWSGDRNYTATSYGFRMQAVSDLIWLVFYMVRLATNPNTPPYLILTFLTDAHKKIGVSVTLLLAIARFVKVYSPMREHELMSRSRMKIAFGVICALGFVLQLLDSLYRSCSCLAPQPHKISLKIADVIVQDNVVFIVPILAQNILIVAVLVRIHTVTSALDHDNPVEWRSMRRLAYTVFIMCFVTLLVHPVFRVIVIFIKAADGWKEKPYLTLVYRVGHVLLGINSAINLFIYIKFVSQFKRLFVRRFGCLGNLVRSTTVVTPLAPPGTPPGTRALPGDYSRDVPSSQTEPSQSLVPRASVQHLLNEVRQSFVEFSSSQAKVGHEHHQRQATN